jgi:hypothetical protein
LLASPHDRASWACRERMCNAAERDS